ncbi:MAG: hypothetical protein ACK5AK_03960 [Gemmatimonas sp.]
MIVLFAHDRAFRTAVDRALRAGGAQVRGASRQAELAKALAGATPCVLVVGPSPEDRSVAQAVLQAVLQAVRKVVLPAVGAGWPASPVPAITLVETTPEDTVDAIVRRALPMADGPLGR